jgi:hypothetical protein
VEQWGTKEQESRSGSTNKMSMPHRDPVDRREMKARAERNRRLRDRVALRDARAIVRREQPFSAFLLTAGSEMSKADKDVRWLKALEQAISDDDFGGAAIEIKTLRRLYAGTTASPHPRTAYRIGRALRRLGVPWCSGPVSLYRARRLEELARFFVALSRIESPKKNVAAGAYRTALLFANLWGADDYEPGHLSDDKVVAFAEREHLEARRRLCLGSVGERHDLAVEGMFDQAWEASSNANLRLTGLEAVTVRAASLGDVVGVDAVWTLASRWIATIDGGRPWRRFEADYWRGAWVRLGAFRPLPFPLVMTTIEGNQ